MVNDGVFGDTLELALKLHPSVRQVLVVAQSRSVYGYDRRVRSALERFTPRVELTYVPQQSLPGLLAAVTAAPSNSLILFGRYIPGGAGSNNALPRGAAPDGGGVAGPNHATIDPTTWARASSAA